MTKFFEKLHSYEDIGCLALRLSIGAIFLIHGVLKWKMGIWQAEPNEMMSANMITLFKVLSVVEPLGGLGLIFGFLNQLAALGLAIIMAGAIYFKIQVWGMDFIGQQNTGWEFDLALLAVLVHLFISGAGKYSLDHVVYKKANS